MITNENKNIEKEQPRVKIAMQQFCMTCIMHNMKDMSGSILAPRWIYCKYWNELKYDKGLCANWVGGA